MADIRPIETVYKGFRFRSRLEARWAVFFDGLRLKYEYELEGYRLPSGAGYLPDFVLPDLAVYVEVKPNRSIPYADLKKIVEFALGWDKNVLLIIGTPTQEEMFLINRCTCRPLEEYEWEYEIKPDEADIVSDFLSDLSDWASVAFGSVPLSRGWCLVYRSLPPTDEVTLKEALLKAKQARFEFGESG
ncbi:MAG TPA: hypothetical protein VNK04_17695 [Gemmataceae bacterium]|nr:hypothetical protein [Gemmataceae bacterium]